MTACREWLAGEIRKAHERAAEIGMDAGAERFVVGWLMGSAGIGEAEQHELHRMLHPRAVRPLMRPPDRQLAK